MVLRKNYLIKIEHNLRFRNFVKRNLRKNCGS